MKTQFGKQLNQLVTKKNVIFSIIFLWIFFILYKYYNIISITPDDYWFYSTTIKILPIILFQLVLFGIGCIIFRYIFKQNVGTSTVITLILATSVILGLAGDKLLWLKALSFFGIIIILGFGGIFVYYTILRVRIPYWAGLLFSMILIHYWLFTIALFELFKMSLVIIPVVLLDFFGFYYLYINRRTIRNDFMIQLKKVTWSEALLLNAIWIVLCWGFISSYAPEFYFDAAYSHVPFMINLVHDGALNAFPYSMGAHLLNHPIQLIEAGGYLAIGEIGAKWISFLFGVILLYILIYEINVITKNRLIAIASGFFFISTPFIWVWLTNCYIDLATIVFSLASLVLLRKSLQGDILFLPLSAIIIGFTASVKLNAALFVVISVIILIYYFKNKAIKDDKKTWGISLILLIISILPWHVLVYAWTGGIPRLSISTIITPFYELIFGISIGDHIIPNASAFSFPHGLIDLLIFPWVITFQTSSFGEIFDGAMGPWLLIFSPLLMLIVANQMKKNKNNAEKILAAYFLIFAMFFVITSLQVPYLRYWFPGFGILTICFALSYMNALKMVNIRYSNKFNIVLITSIILISMVIFSWGIATNYAADSQSIYKLYSGEITKETFIKDRAGDFPSIINSGIEKNETVIVLGSYYQISSLNTKVIANLWGVDIKDVDSKHSTKFNSSQYEEFFDKNNVHYLIIDRNIINNLPDETISQYLPAKNLLSKYNDFNLYTLKPELEEQGEIIQTISLSNNFQSDDDTYGWLPTGLRIDSHSSIAKGNSDNPIYQIFQIPHKSKKINGKIVIQANVADSSLIADIIWMKENIEIDRSVVSTTGKKIPPTKIEFYNIVPDQAEQLMVVLRPWRPQDGTISIIEGNISWIE